MKWRIIGADLRTGNDVTEVIDADSEADARAMAGQKRIAVNSIGIAVNYQSPAGPDVAAAPAKEIPSYEGLSMASGILNGLAVAGFVGAIILTWCALSVGKLDLLISAGGAAAGSAIMLAAGSGCKALKDIAINSFGLRK